MIVMQSRSLPLEVTWISTPVRLLKGKPRIQQTNFPSLQPSTWFRFMLDIGGESILGGHNIRQQSAWRQMFSTFWDRFSKSSPGIDLRGVNPEVAIPICIHGDEGRGKVNRPIMVLAFQPLVSWLGPAVVNSSGPFGMLANVSISIL